MTAKLLDNLISINFSDLRNNSNISWIDVRCPREFNKGHLTNAINIPIFSDDEYQKLGEIYKQKGKDEASQLGIEYTTNSKIKILEKINQIKGTNFIVYCARGGMRSKGFQTILSEYGFKSTRLNRGYKEIRRDTLNSFKLRKKIIIIAGSTGVGKTTILNDMKNEGHNIIDLEKLANHRGSAFGDLGFSYQVSQQQFENDLSFNWLRADSDQYIFFESESRKIGKVSIPNDIWEQMQNAPYLKIDMKIDRRVKNLIKDYGQYPKFELEKRINQISRKLGGENTKIALKLLDSNKLYELGKFLLEKYYDKMYASAYEKRISEKKIIKVSSETNKEIISYILNKI